MIDIEKEKILLRVCLFFCIKALIKGLYEIQSYDTFFDPRDYALT